MKTMIVAVLAAMIGIGVANAAPATNAPPPAQDSTASWANA